MDGGVLSIPFDKLTAFYETYVKAVTTGEKVFVVERMTERYNFFVDLDYKDTEELAVAQVKRLGQIICDKVRQQVVAPPGKRLRLRLRRLIK